MLLVSIAILALLSVVLLRAGAMMFSFALITVAASVWFSLKRSGRWRALALLDAGGARLISKRDENAFSGVLSANAVSPLFISLHMAGPEGRRVRIGIFFDELSDHDFRRLSARLRLG
ncbi:MAG: hypothetical protein LC637_04260 [Xanthomonadaceae bacterium]|nr:hypothetical protein [Xanthomonadaceae bacterium]